MEKEQQRKTGQQAVLPVHVPLVKGGGSPVFGETGDSKILPLINMRLCYHADDETRL
jgi:hypothetical protein